MTHSLPLYRRPKVKWHWRERIRLQDEVTRCLKEFLDSSASNQPTKATTSTAGER